MYDIDKIHPSVVHTKLPVCGRRVDKSNCCTIKETPRFISQMAKPEALLLAEARLEASEAKRQVLELTQKVEALQRVIAEQTAIIKENTSLLRKQRLPPRPYLNSTSKALIACRQRFKCANTDGECPLFKLGDGTFQEDLWECDHISPWNKSGRHTGNIHALCSACHAKRTRRQIAERVERNASDTEDEDQDYISRPLNIL